MAPNIGHPGFNNRVDGGSRDFGFRFLVVSLSGHPTERLGGFGISHPSPLTCRFACGLSGQPVTTNSIVGPIRKK